MAQATICDRCGAIYKSNKNNHRYHIFDCKKDLSQLTTGEYRGVRVGDMLDLCDKCSVDLTAWIEEINNG